MKHGGRNIIRKVGNFLQNNRHNIAKYVEVPSCYCEIKVFYLPTDAQQSCFKIKLKGTLKQLLHISVQSPSGSVLFELAKVIVIKIIS